MRILEAGNPKELKRIMQDIDVDRHGIEIMYPKALTYLVRINKLSNIAANILKQEMLSLGADCAIARGALTGKAKKTDCLLMGNLAQFNRLSTKLKLQPFGLDSLSEELSSLLDNYKKTTFALDLGRFRLRLGQRTLLMGVVNLTPDSFSGDGLLNQFVYNLPGPNLGLLEDHVAQMVSDGADIIDIGAESSRPGARSVPVKEELKRVLPAIKKIAKKIKVPISIDTYKAEVARAALDCGASMVNDISGLRDRDMARVVAKYKCALIIMHMKGRPRSMQRSPVYKSLIEEIIGYLENAIRLARRSGIPQEKIIIDPGIGFGKSLEHNLAILKSLREFKALGRPILVGVSRKSFIGKILNEPPEKRLYGTLASCVLAALNGADILRVHDVKEVKQALKLLQAITSAQ